MVRTPVRHGNAGSDRDPDHIGDHIDRFAAFPSDPPTSAAERVALRKTWYHLKANRRATRRDITDAVYRDSKVAAIYNRSGVWWRTALLPYLPELPYIVPPTDGDAWTFDPTTDPTDRPDFPVDPSRPSDDAIDAAIDSAMDAVGLERPHADPHLANRNRRAIRDSYDILLEQGTADRATLRETYTPTTAPVDGLYADAATGFRVVVAPVLRRLPGVDAPNVVGQDYRFIGADADRA